ncbi:hypothetical protein [Trinickia sp.]|uniref:hypothetical protein n=1 Tax=Trinickia sp. TaxID=2571163 RepID=UPI003F822A6A
MVALLGAVVETPAPSAGLLDANGASGESKRRLSVREPTFGGSISIAICSGEDG